MSEWKEVRLEDILLIPSRNGLTKPSKIRGKGVKMIAMGELFAHSIIRDIEMDRVPVTEKELQSSTIEPDDLFFARQSLTLEGAGKCSIVKSVSEPTVFESHLIRLRINKEKANPWFVYYYFNSYYGKHSIQNIVNQVAAAGIKGSDLVKLEIPLPSLDVQNKIVALLQQLDDKIAVNRRICENLEAQAQALFKHWFIDFAPFKDGKFVESELGMIPEGWRVVSLDEATSKFGTGLNPRQNFKLGHGDNYYVTIKNMLDNKVVLDNKCDRIDDAALEVIQKRSKLSKGDLLFSGIGTIGKVAIVVDDPVNWNTSESVFNMHPSEGFTTAFLYVLLRSKPLQNYVKINSQGAVQQGIRMASLKAYKFPCPPKDLLTKFYQIIEDLITQKTIMDKEICKLSSLRDTLLPKLMSGQIKL